MDNTDEQGRVAEIIDATKPLTEWDNEPSVRDLKQDLTDAKSYHDSRVTQIDEWLDNLHVRGKAKAKAPKGSSQIVPRLIRKQAEWRYAALSEPFLSTPDIFTISPVSWEDKKAAQQNQLVLNNQFNTKLGKTSFIDEYVRTAVDEGTVIVRTGWDYEEEEYQEMVPIVEFTPNPNLAPMYEQLAQRQQQDPEEYAQNVPQEIQEAHQMTMEQGVPMEARITGYQEETFTRVVKNQPTLEVCDYRNVIIDPSCMGNIDKAGFVIYSFESSLSELERDGKYHNLEHINLTSNSILSEPDHASTDASNFNFSDEPRKKFVVYEYWGYWDIDGSGVVQPIVAAWVGDTLIRMEENPFPDKKIPFVSVQYLPVRRDIYGEPDGALLEDNQKILGAVTRGMIDLMGKSANSQTGFRKDMLDVSNRRKYEKGLDYEYNQTVNPREGIFTHTYPEIPQSAQFMLQLQNHEAESLTGVKAFSSGVSGESLGTTATGVRGALDAASKRELGILRRLADGMTKIGRKIIAMNAEFLGEEEVIRVTNEEFVPVKRDDLAGNFDLKLSISTAEEDNAKAQELAFMLQTVGPNVDPKITFMIMADIARLRKMPELAKRLEDYEPQPDPMAQQMQQLEMEKLQSEIAYNQSRTVENQAQAMLDQAKARQLGSDADLKDLEYVEQESGVKQERDLQKQGAQAQANILLEREKQRLKSLESTAS